MIKTKGGKPATTSSCATVFDDADCTNQDKGNQIREEKCFPNLCAFHVSSLLLEQVLNMTAAE